MLKNHFCLVPTEDATSEFPETKGDLVMKDQYDLEAARKKQKKSPSIAAD